MVHRARSFALSHLLALTFAIPSVAPQALAALDDCERGQANLKRVLVQKLEQRARPAETNERRNGAPSFESPAGEARWITIGPATFIDHGLPRRSDESWTTERQSWEIAYHLYLKIRDQAQDPRWPSLNQQVRSLVREDMRRNSGVNYSLSRSSESALLALQAEVRACISAPACTDLVLSAEAGEFARSIALYAPHLEWISAAAGSPAKLRPLLKNFEARLEEDAGLFAFVANPTIERVDARTLRLPLDPGPFNDPRAAATLEALIESQWSSPELQLDIQWKPRALDPEIFELVLSNTPGERPEVDLRARTLTLHPEGSLDSILHEIGHVLGLPDRYYTIWSSYTCSYDTQLNPGDLMSVSATGRILESDWKLLDQAYPQR